MEPGTVHSIWELAENLNQRVKKLEVSLASAVPPGSESGLRGKYLHRIRRVKTHLGSPSEIPVGCIGADFVLFSDQEYQTLIHTPLPTSGPPTPDLADSPNSNTENPDTLVPVWIREYVQRQIDQRLGSTVPPGSESALREQWSLPGSVESGLAPLDQWDLLGELARIAKDRDQVRKTCNEYAGHLHSGGAFIVGKPASVEDVRAWMARRDANSRQPAGGPPTPDLAGSPDSNTQPYLDPYYGTPPSEIVDKTPQHRIGVHDYASLVSALRSNFKQVFGDDQPLTDPQDMIQRLTAEIRRLKGGSEQGFGRAVRLPTEENGPEDEA